MAAIKHIRSAEAQAHALVGDLSRSIQQARTENQYVLARVLRAELDTAIALRDRLCGLKQAQEESEQYDPRVKPAAAASR